MTWIAISAPDQRWVCPKRMGDGLRGRMDLLARGSMMIETRLSPDGRPQTLLGYERRHPWPGSISLQAIPGGGLVLVLRQGEELFHAVVENNRDARTDVLRVTFCWDAPNRWGRLAIERPETDAIQTIDTPPPPPLMLEDIHTMVARPQLAAMDGDVVFLAVSTEIEPVGPMPSLSPMVPVLTPEGYRPACRLKCGDLVETPEGPVPVLHRVSRTVPARGSFSPVRLRAPYFGLSQDLIVAPHQRLLTGGSDVEYLFGREAVLVPACNLVNGFAAMFEEGHHLVEYTHLVLPGNEPLIVADAALESLYVGRLRRSPERLARTVLADCPARLLPEHHRSTFQVLRPFEAITLAEARTA